MKYIIITSIIIFTLFQFRNNDLDVIGASFDNYQINQGVRGYITKTDPTATPPDFLVSGSQNVIINDQEKVETRAGYELFGVASTSANAIISDFVWRTSGATSTAPSELFLRHYETIVQFYATSTWEDLWTQATSSPIRWTSVWKDSEILDLLLFVNASSTLFEWSGGQGTFSSDTSNTITINETIDESRFLTSGNLRLKDSTGVWQEYTYTGYSGSQFTGVSPDPTTSTFGANAFVVQGVSNNVNTPASGFVSNTIKTLNNQVFVGSEKSRNVYISSNNDYTDYSFSSPRVVGEGELLTLDDTTIGFEASDDDNMIVFSGKDRVYQISFEVSSGSTGDRELTRVRPLLISSGQGALSQELIGKIKQAIVWVSNNKELVELGQVENLPSPQAISISDPIKPDFASANFTNGEIEFWRNQIFITAPPDGKQYIYDLSKRFWQPPQILGMRRMSVYGDVLYGHGQSVEESYKLYTGLNDNNNPMSAKAHFGYTNNGRRDSLKSFNRLFTEMYLASNTKLNIIIVYEWLGSNGLITYELDGADETFLFIPSEDASLGVNSLGINPLGGVTSITNDLPKYRRFKPIAPKDYFEYQIRLESNETDYAWQSLAVGSNSQLSNNLPVKITK